MKRDTSRHKYLISIVGPTASGKTSLGVHLAKHFGTEVISADSRQVFTQMDIGTAKPTSEEMDDVPHHLLDCVEPDAPFSAGKYGRAVETLLEELFQHHDVVLMVGGSGFYLQAVWEGFDDIPDIPTEIREQVIQDFETNGLEALTEELLRIDPKLHGRIDLHNPRRVMRGVEVFRATGQSLSSLQQQKEAKQPDYTLIKIGLDLDRAVLYDRINLRVDLMMEAGLHDEVQRLWDQYGPDSVAMTTVGYQEFVPYLKGEYDLEEALRLVKRNSRRYAKRQFTWFRRFPDLTWFPHDDWPAIKAHIASLTS